MKPIDKKEKSTSLEENSASDNEKKYNSKIWDNEGNLNKNWIITSNINSEFKNVAAEPNGIIEKNDADIIEVKSYDNCLYRCFSYFLFGSQNFFLEIKNLIIEWIENNYDKFFSFFVMMKLII